MPQLLCPAITYSFLSLTGQSDELERLDSLGAPYSDTQTCLERKAIVDRHIDAIYPLVGYDTTFAYDLNRDLWTGLVPD